MNVTDVMKKETRAHNEVFKAPKKHPCCVQHSNPVRIIDELMLRNKLAWNR